VGADSIVLSGGYKDDEDYGDTIIYTGQGGLDPKTGEVVEDQVLARGNLALAKSMQEGHPVRVIRGAGSTSPYAPEVGYRYDGLYRVHDYWRERGESGHYVWRYRLVKIDELAEIPTRPEAEEPESYAPAPRAESTVTRVVRDTANSRRIKEMYDYTCQVCGERLEGPAGPYAEAAHIQPLGAPHNGPDVASNILCLCPNHHALFDIGAFTIRDDYELTGLAGGLEVDPSHSIDERFLRYRREHYSRD
jgi:putative restriction endonuclease